MQDSSVSQHQKLKGENRAGILAERILRVAEKAHNEEELRIGVEKLLEPALQAMGVQMSPAYERTYLDGQSDAVYGKVIIEYEKPGKFRLKRSVQETEAQLERYMRNEAGSTSDWEACRRLVGVGLDGERIFFARFRRGRSKAKLTAPHHTSAIAQPEGRPENEVVLDRTEIYPVDHDSVESLLLYLRALRRRPLTPEGLADEFGPTGTCAQTLVAAFYSALKVQDHIKVKTFFEEWDRLFGIVYGQDLTKAKRDAKALAKEYGLPQQVELKPLLFAVHTYFALFMKLLSAELASLQAVSLTESIIADLPSLSSRKLKAQLRDLEGGALFARLGIHNFLEGDFFSWYLPVWDSEIEDGIRELARTLDGFESATSTLEPSYTQDLLKKLYQYLVPADLRHDLGEYYTPDWLAELVLDRAGVDGSLTDRVLDPACGSGTFLVLTIRRMLRRASESGIGSQEAVRAILNNVVGFDLNPLAVIAARTNCLLALGALVREVMPLELPIYLCDSVLGPIRETGAQQSFQEEYVIPSTVGTFRIPKVLVDRGDLPRLCTILEESATGSYTPSDFRRLCKSEWTSLEPLEESALESLFLKIRQLELDGRDGIWARIIRNAFAPVFAGEFDYVIGNPPWVNWEDLSEDYRKATEGLWQSYGLVSFKGQLGRMREGKKDLSMLMLYASADHYLRLGGTLAFLVTQTLFKTSGAGDGFRRFRVGEGSFLRVQRVEDMSNLKPFESAANQTAMIVLEKGRETSYPVPYVIWTKSQRGRLGVDLSLQDVLQRTSHEEVAAEPVALTDPRAPWLTGPFEAVKALGKAKGPSHYAARLGTNSGGLNSVYWLKILDKRTDGHLLVENLHDTGRTHTARMQAAVEPDLVYPLLRGRDVDKWGAIPSNYILLPQDKRRKREGIPEDRMRVEFPATWRFLKKFEEDLSRRPDRKYYPKGSAFYTMRNVAAYTYAPYKVVWPEVGNHVRAAVASTHKDDFLGRRPLIPDHTIVFVPTEDQDEAAFIAALLNSSPAQLIIRGYITLHPSPHVMERVAIPHFS